MNRIVSRFGVSTSALGSLINLVITPHRRNLLADLKEK